MKARAKMFHDANLPLTLALIRKGGKLGRAFALTLALSRKGRGNITYAFPLTLALSRKGRGKSGR